MVRYIALLRGINVGGHNKIRMAELKNSLKQLGLENIKTYIQSGNILFESEESEESLQKKIHYKIKEDFGVVSTVVIRTAKQLHGIVYGLPFNEQDISSASDSAKGECLYVAMLPEAPSVVSKDKLLSYTNNKEHCVIIGRDVYLLFHDSIRNSKLNNNLTKLDVPATIRNWRTINKLLSMVEELDEKSYN
ncbi:DUF1697 domain-containing protein [Bacillus carboniphilus]|uniref:DUF1697 domain-containing protein n=1 Tax=Bacillus carboniphilus TaxID=86663 RepID=A0ABY9JVN8_9BACI|nr:DUF1697 domain-containing protein [Bacillus carboniphilus]WLR41705.1 DUF1697 domain-containing protein [Bacillus carboniphilus]